MNTANGIFRSITIVSCPYLESAQRIILSASSWVIREPIFSEVVCGSPFTLDCVNLKTVA